MNIVIVSSTHGEIAPLNEFLTSKLESVDSSIFRFGNGRVSILVTGTGMHRMSFHLGGLFSVSKPDLIINAGICGVFPGKGSIGEVVQVTSETIADLGAENIGGNILSLEALGLKEDISSTHGLVNPNASAAPQLRPVRGITANTAHGDNRSIERIIDIWDPDVETMEGGAFFYCCLKGQVPFIEIRAISNIVELRNRDAWNIPLAIRNLSDSVISVLRGLQ